MSELTARHYTSGEPVRFSWEAGRITSIDPVSETPSRNLWIAPPLFDLQINGFAGIDFQNDDVSHADLERAVRALHAAGCGRFFLTLISDEWPRMLSRLDRKSTRLNSSHLVISYAVFCLNIHRC